MCDETNISLAVEVEVPLTDSWGYLVNGLSPHYVSSVWHLFWDTTWISDGLTRLHPFLLRASDLVMKVDALLSAAPKGESRRDVQFVRNSHRWATLDPSFSFTFVMNGLNILITSFQAAQIFWGWFLLFNFVLLFSSLVFSIIPRVRTRYSMTS